MEWFPWLVLGHFIGDFVLQKDWMALNKKTSLLPCVVHCFTYSTVVTLCLSVAIHPSIFLFLFIYATHHILDGTHLVDKWMKFYGIRSWDSSLPRGEDRYGRKTYIIWTEYPTTKDTVVTTLGAIIYVAIDNTLHFAMMMFGIRYLFT